MKAILAITVIFCFFIVAHSQSLQCATRLANLGTCTARLATAIQNSTDFCNECDNSLVSYFQDCTGGTGVEQVQAGKLNFLESEGDPVSLAKLDLMKGLKSKVI